MSNPLFSVVVPVYNTRPYIEECLDSLLAQTFRDFEVILVDDGSTDGAEQIADRYATEHDCIRVFHQPNAGSCMARKKGSELSTGDYILHVDSDDYVAPDFLESFAAEIEATQADVVVSGHTCVEKEGCRLLYQSIPVGHYDRRQIEEIIIPHLFSYGSFYHFGLFPSLCMACVRRELMQESQAKAPVEVMMGTDLIVAYPCFLNSQSLSVIGSTGYYYRQQSDSISHSFDERRYLKLLGLFGYIEQAMPVRTVAKESYLDYVFYQVTMMVGAYMVLGVRILGYQACKQSITKLLAYPTVVEALSRPASFARGLPRKWRIKYFLLRHRLLRLYKLMTRL